MQKRIIECVPNFSEGRNMETIKQITDVIEAAKGVKLLDVDPGEATNRTVVTFVGEPAAVCDAAVAAIKRATELIDMRQHKGAHPRMGACDVCPLIPVSGITLEECAELARALAKRISEVKMNTIISKIDIKNIDKNEIKKQAELIKEGKTVIFPTETVYGLGANALDENAVKKIYEAKGRPSDNPLIVHIYNKEEVYNLAKDVNEKAEIIMEHFWPGPITIILNKKDIVPYKTSGGLETVAIRMPYHSIAREIIKQAGVPIAAPSANISGRPSPTKADHVYEEMNGRVSGIVLGGDSNFGLESTVLDVTTDTPMILRPGSITKEDLEKVIGEVLIDPSLAKKEDNDKAKAPGMKYTHYSPDADVYIVSGSEHAIVEKINSLVEENEERGLKTGVMCLEKNKDNYKGEVLSLGNTLEEVGSNLFDALRQMDKMNIDIVYSEEFPTDGVGEAIMNRLLKSAGYKTIKV